MAMTPFLALADEDAPPPRHVEMEVACEQVIDKADLDSLPDGLFIADADALAEYWESTEFDMGEKPELEFDEAIVVIEYRDAADPNRVRYMGRVNSDGELEVMGMTTMMGFPPSDQFKLTFLIVPREGVTAVVRTSQRLDEDGKVVTDRAVYPLDGYGE